MSNLNARNENKTVRVKKVVNHGGEENFNVNAKESFVSIATTSMISDKFYETRDEGIQNLVDSLSALKKSDPEFVLKVAAYARKEMNMRSAPQIILVECANRDEFKPYISKWAPLIMSRADEPVDAMAYQLLKYGKPIPNSLKKAIKSKLETFSEYNLAKYQRKNSTVKMADVIKLTHPNLGEVGKKILEGTASADTWEKNLSSGVGDSKKESWEISIPKMGYMALLRNLRNMIKEEIDLKLFKTVLGKLSDKDQVKNSKQFPFRFFSAHRELEQMTMGINPNQLKMVNLALEALGKAINHSVSNVNIEGHNLFLIDSSGSMSSSVSDKSKIDCIDIGLLLGCIGVNKSDSSELWTFDTVTNVRKVRKTLPILDQVSNIRQHCHGGATYLNTALELLNTTGKKFDNIIVVSDYQVYTDRGWGSSHPSTHQALWKKYLSTNPDAKMYSIDLRGYDKGTPVKKDANNVFLFSGWSEKILEMIGADSSGLVQEIESWNPFEDK